MAIVVYYPLVAVIIHCQLGSANDEAAELLKKMMSKIRTAQPLLSDIFTSDSVSYDESSTAKWSMANIGSESAHLTHYDSLSIEGVSQYSEPDIGVLRLVSDLGGVDPELRISFQFEDEDDAFIGATFFSGKNSREHWWARLEALPEPTSGISKSMHFYDLREDFVQSRMIAKD